MSVFFQSDDRKKRIPRSDCFLRIYSLFKNVIWKIIRNEKQSMNYEAIVSFSYSLGIDL